MHPALKQATPAIREATDGRIIASRSKQGQHKAFSPVG
jgi:hypothetical protein